MDRVKFENKENGKKLKKMGETMKKGVAEVGENG